MIKDILPPSVVAADTLADIYEEALFPEEEALIERSVEKRRREFTTARACARKALGLLGRQPAPILPGARGEPLWPSGVVGSITHCTGYRGVVLGESPWVTTIGIDAEPDEELPYGVLEAIALPAETAQVDRLRAADPDVSWDRLLFSIKESVYKAWFPLTQCWLGFDNALIVIDPAGTFSARLLVPGAMVDGRPLRRFAGRWQAKHGLLLTSIVLEPAREKAAPARGLTAPLRRIGSSPAGHPVAGAEQVGREIDGRVR
ncbi:4'-phosphopantetheinyl transferase superfamily protein [Nonomuraea rosea]|uniref:4'-phosphopantetheinyl transferase superfamily protein n=1 Tax=Nonomuraea rosea TaxID=638574 RepID=A0ABP6XGR3_9ACTN